MDLAIGSNVAKVNGVAKTMDTVAVLRQDRTVVPVRFVSEFMGAAVEWDEASSTVIVRQ